MGQRAVGSLTPEIPVIDYEGSAYRQEFWEQEDRRYEDAVERVAIQSLLPAQGGRLAEIGAGFGRLADLYLGYDQVILFDYSRTLLRDAVERWGQDPRFVFVAGNVYELPLAEGVLDALVMVRVMHHLAQVPAALTQLHRVLHRGSVAVMEYANKRHLKAIARWLLGRQSWSPFVHEPVEFVKLNFDFHPAWMARQWAQAGFQVRRQLAVSHFRVPWLKRRISPAALARVERPLMGWGGRFPLAPSVIARLEPVTQREPAPEAFRPRPVAVPVERLLRCPRCGREPLDRLAADVVACPGCGRRYRQADGIWDMKEPLGSN